MGLSKSGMRLKRELQSIVGTHKDIQWEPVRSDDFIHPYGKPPKIMEGDVFILIGGKEPEPLTDMDWDMAINDPSRLDRSGPIPPEEIAKIHIAMDSRGNILSADVLKKWDDKKDILACIKYRFNGKELDRCLTGVEKVI